MKRFHIHVRVELRQRAESADAAVLDPGKTSCCYAKGDKHWALPLRNVHV